MSFLKYIYRLYRPIRKKRWIIVVFLFVFLALIHQKGGKPVDSKTDDSIVSLKSQIGYLRRKIAKLDPGHGGVTIQKDDMSIPLILIITPTYARHEQKATLTRLCHTFLLVPNIYWILVEDAKVKTKLVTNFLENCGVSYTHLNIPTPADWKLKSNEKSWRKPRGVLQRNEALEWIRENANTIQNGVIYFADDDNTYSLELFDEMRYIKKVGVWPVGLVGGLMVEKPKVDKTTSKVIAWDVVWSPKRPFALDMAGFAVNLNLFRSKTKAKFVYEVKRGYQESEFLKHLVTMDELEPKADLCTKVLVWHTRNEKPKLDMEAKLKTEGKLASNLDIEV